MTLDFSRNLALANFSENKKLSELKPARDVRLMPYNKYRAISSLILILRSLAGYSCNA